MVEGTPIQKYLDDFNSTIIGLENLKVQIKDEDKAILLVVSLPHSYKYLREILLYSNNDTLSFKEVKANLLSKGKFELEVHFLCQYEEDPLKRKTQQVKIKGT